MSQPGKSSFSLEEREVAESAAGLWWVFLLTGLAWIVVSWLILRWNPTSINTIAYLFGFVAVFFGINELLMIAGASTGWKIFHILFGLVFAGAGILAFFNPTQAFFALAGIIGFVFILKGTFDIIVAIATREEISVWWLQLVVGIVELLLGFWAAGPGYEQYGRKVILLVLWVGLSCLFRGITEIVFAFKLHGLKKRLAPA